MSDGTATAVTILGCGVVLMRDMVERTYHLNENTSHHNNPKDICTDMCQLIVPRESQLESNTESLFVSSYPTPSRPS